MLSVRSLRITFWLVSWFRCSVAPTKPQADTRMGSRVPPWYQVARVWFGVVRDAESVRCEQPHLVAHLCFAARCLQVPGAHGPEPEDIVRLNPGVRESP